VALVTGAARGIGAAVVRRLVGDGWRVVALDAPGELAGLGYATATRAELDAVVTTCPGGTAAAALGDVRDQGDLDAAVALALARFGRLDAAVAAAGVVTGGAPAWELDDARWQVGLEVNLTGVWRTFRAAVPAILDTTAPRHGRLVAVASAAAAQGTPRLADYAAAKAGVVALVRSMAVELGPHGVTVNAVAPGATDTAILAPSAAIYGIEPADFAVHHPIGRLVQPGEVADAVGWLCGRDRDAVTGVVLPVDGGMTA